MAPRVFRAVALAVLACVWSLARAEAQESTSEKPIGFAAPAGVRPAGPATAGDAYGRILPSGRIVHPTGTSVVVGMNSIGFALTPDGRYAIVSNDDERQGKTHSALDPRIAGGYSLAVIDTMTMTVVSQYASPLETFFAGVVALRDPADPMRTLVLASGGPSNAVYAFDLDATGTLVPDAHHVIAIPGPTDVRFANAAHSFPGTIVLSPSGAYADVIDNLGNDVSQIAVATRTVVKSPVAVGYFPFGAAETTSGLLVANEGLEAYGVLPTPVVAPSFASVAPDLDRASSLTLVPQNADDTLATSVVPIPADQTPDGVRAVGGAHPTAIVASRTRPYAFVALGNVDRVVTIALGATPHAVGGTELRLYDRGPYGTQPTALALSADEKRLYVALSGINAIAILDATDPLHLHRVGLIPTGWYPDAVALSNDGRYLYVANAKGIAEDTGFVGDAVSYVDSSGHVEEVNADSNAIWSTFERLDLQSLDVRITTPKALADLRAIRPVTPSTLVPQRFDGNGSRAIKHVVLILEENKTYDSMLGDLTDANGAPYGPGDAGYVSFGAAVTPNLHALARTYALAGNIFADAEESDAGHQFISAGIASDFTEKTLLLKSGRRPLVNKNEDPEDYPRAGYIFDSLADRAKSYRDYGDLVRISGYDEGQAPSPKTDDPQFVSRDDTTAPTQGLGGLFSLDVPAPAALGGHVDLNYPGWNLRIRDVRRAQEFVRDFDPLARSGQMPAFTEIWLPADHTGVGLDVPPIPEEVADGDRALGLIVDEITHLPDWKSTAIFILPDDAQSTRDHVNEHRTYAIVVSPYAKRHFIGMHHLSTVSVLKTEEELLGLPALSLGDALATDMSDFFTSSPALAPFIHEDAPTQTGSIEGARIAAFLAQTDQSSPDADSDRTARLIELSREADSLAAHRDRYDAGYYAGVQRQLYDRAAAIVR